MTSEEKGELVSPACDPTMPSSERQRLIHHRSILYYSRGGRAPVFQVPFGAHAGRWMNFYGLLFGLGLVGGISFTGGWAVAAWICSGFFGIIFATSACLAAGRARYAVTARRSRDQFIDITDLDVNFRPLLIRAKNAIRVVFNSDVYSHGMLDTTANLVALRQQEWEIAAALRDIRALRDKKPKGQGGKISAPIEAAQTAVLHEVGNAVSDRVEALEGYANRVTAADDRYRDHQRALKLIEQNEDYM